MPYTKTHFTNGIIWNKSEITISLNSIDRSKASYPRVSTADYTNLVPSTNNYYDTNYGTQGFASAESLRPHIQKAIDELTKHLNPDNIKLRILSPTEDQSQADMTISLVNDLESFKVAESPTVPARWATLAGVAKTHKVTTDYVFWQETTIRKADILFEKDNVVSTSTQGTWGFEVIMHELGHVLGLQTDNPKDHPHLHNPSYTRDNTIMSYTKGTEVNGTPYASTPMMYDIAALQDLYGARTSSTAGSNTYTATGTSKAWTLWDSGGEHLRQVVMAAITSVMMTCIAQPAYADSLDKDGYEKWYKEEYLRCGPVAREKAISSATHVVVATLERYLDDQYGAYKVILSLRGDIPAGAYIKDYAVKPPPEYPSVVVYPEPPNQVEIGRSVYYLSDKYNKIENYYRVEPILCVGKARFPLGNQGVVSLAELAHDVLSASK